MIEKDGTQRKKTLVEEGTQFKGSLLSDCPIEVKGRVEGDLTAPALAVSASGAVHGHVKVGEMRSEGELAGEFDADVVQLSGRVRDNTVIRARSLEVKLAPPSGKMQVIFGECELEVGGEQAHKKEGVARVSEVPKTISVRPAGPDAAAPKTDSIPPPPNGAG